MVAIRSSRNTRLLIQFNTNYFDIISVSIGKPILFLFSAVRMTECYILVIAIIPKAIKRK